MCYSVQGAVGQARLLLYPPAPGCPRTHSPYLTPSRLLDEWARVDKQGGGDEVYVIPARWCGVYPRLYCPLPVEDYGLRRVQVHTGRAGPCVWPCSNAGSASIVHCCY